MIHQSVINGDGGYQPHHLSKIKFEECISHIQSIFIPENNGHVTPLQFAVKDAVTRV